MRRFVALLVVGCLVFSSTACGGAEGTPATSATPSGTGTPAPEPAPGNHKLSLRHGDIDRTYLLHAPPGYDPAKPIPLVFALHFYPGSGDAMQKMVGLDDKADREGFLVAYPDGVHGGFNALVCCGNADDVGYLVAITEHLTANWGADPDRVFLTGISNGGDLSYRAAIDATGVFAAIGVVSGGFGGPRAAVADYAPKRPVSVVTFIGTEDRYLETFRTGIDTWRQRLRCTAGAPRAVTKGSPVTRSSARCADGSDVEVYTVQGMGHLWPGATAGQLADPDAGIVATDVIWDFFVAHPRRP